MLQRCSSECICLSINRTPALNSVILSSPMCGHSFLISLRSDSYLNLSIYGQNSTDSWRTTCYDNGQSPGNKASNIQKLVHFGVFLLTSAKAKKFQRWRLIDKTVHYDYSATKKFFKNRHNCLSEGFTFFLAMGSTRSETKHSPRLQSKTHTHTHTHSQTDCYNPPPTLGLTKFSKTTLHYGYHINDRPSTCTCTVNWFTEIKLCKYMYLPKTTLWIQNNYTYTWKKNWLVPCYKLVHYFLQLLLYPEFSPRHKCNPSYRLCCEMND